MNRRRFVFLLGLIAGCNTRTPGGDSTDAPADTATSTSTRAPTSTNNPTATQRPTSTEISPEEPTETPTEEPTNDEIRGAEELARAERKLTRVLNAFTDGYGSELTDVVASSTGVQQASYDIQQALAKAQAAYNDAADRAANDEQERRAERMQACWQFLRYTTRTQFTVAEGYKNLVRAREAFENVNSDRGHTAVEEVKTARLRADTRYRNLEEAATSEDASVIEAITVSEYESKMAQLEADIATYRDLDDSLRSFAEGIDWLEAAQAEFNQENRNVQRAEDQADEAIDYLRTAKSDLIDMINEGEEDTSLTPMLKSLRSLAIDKIDKAREINL